ncbi:tetratricopeptide repeat protein [Amycolatopsis sp. lyj-90]|uniref:AfsR/SARP family transcriptional regulator n=1 Tax=Amycolatopsis sp. lyj-90 TaxID=2789285 RepID=UPI00397C4A9F
MRDNAQVGVAEFRLLGPLEVVLDGERRHLGGGRQDKLLAALLLAGGGVLTTSNLIDVLWEDAPPDTARRQVHNAIAALRKCLGTARSIVVTDGAHYRVDVEKDLVDAQRFAAAHAEARKASSEGERKDAIASLQVALGLWRGPALAGLSGRFIDAAAARLNEQRLEARELLVDLRLASGETGSLISELTELVTANPLRERFSYQLILALHRCRRQPEALALYERTRARLADELGVDPGQELRDLHQRMLRGDPELELLADRHSAPGTGAIKPCVLPHDIADFTGRSAEIDRLLAAEGSTDDTALVITAVDGMAGVGKTTVAVRVAHQLADQYPDGQLFIDLHGYTPGEHPLETGAALDQLLRSLGLPPEQVPHDVESKVARWRSELADRRMIIVLDNAANAAQVRALLPGSPSGQAIITSRRSLSTLEGVTPVPLEPMPEDEAIELFRRIAGQKRVDREPDRLREVVAQCGRLPLAIRIAASRLRHRPMWTIEYLSSRLANERRRLNELSTADRSVRAAFTVSYRHLPGRQRRLYRLLGLHPGSDFDSGAAATLLNAPSQDVEALLEELLDVHLLTQHKPGRYHFHDLVRQHAQDVAEEEEPPDERRSAIERLTTHYVELATSAEKVLGQAKSLLAAEHRNLVAIASSAFAAGLLDQARLLPLTVGPLLLRNGYLDDALDIYEHGLEAARRAGNRAAEATLRSNLGVAQLGIGCYDEAESGLREALAITRELGDPDGEASALRHIGTVYIRLGRYDAAIATLQTALGALSESAAPFDRASVLANLGVALTKAGRYDEAAEYHLGALGMISGRDNHYAEAMGLINVGWTNTLIGDLAVARRYLLDALSLTRRIGAKEAEARSLYILADCLRRNGDTDEALELGREALVIARAIRDQDVESQALNVLGEVHEGASDLEAAVECFRHALRLIKESGQTYKAAQSYRGLGRIAVAQGDEVEALSHWQRALAIATDANLPEREEIEEDAAVLQARASRSDSEKTIIAAMRQRQ